MKKVLFFLLCNLTSADVLVCETNSNEVPADDEKKWVYEIQELDTPKDISDDDLNDYLKRQLDAKIQNNFQEDSAICEATEKKELSSFEIIVGEYVNGWKKYGVFEHENPDDIAAQVFILTDFVAYDDAVFRDFIVHMELYESCMYALNDILKNNKEFKFLASFDCDKGTKLSDQLSFDALMAKLRIALVNMLRGFGIKTSAKASKTIFDAPMDSFMDDVQVETVNFSEGKLGDLAQLAVQKLV